MKLPHTEADCWLVKVSTVYSDYQALQDLTWSFKLEIPDIDPGTFDIPSRCSKSELQPSRGLNQEKGICETL